MPLLDLQTGTAATVFRAIVTILKADTTLNGAISQWMVWDDSEWDTQPVSSLLSPAIRLTPIPASRAWYTPDSFSGYLLIQVEIGIPGYHADDYLNLWEALERALYPYNNRPAQLTIQQTLRNAGSETGLVEFNMPMNDPAAVTNNDGLWWCQGQMRTTIIRVINP